MNRLKFGALAHLIAASAYSGGPILIGGPKTRSRESLMLLEDEYKLIQQKKSKLSANERRSIVAQYERLTGK